jgi:hypothetical protein
VGEVRRVAVRILVIVLAGSSRSDAQPSSLQALLNRISDLSAHQRFAEAESIAPTGSISALARRAPRAFTCSVVDELARILRFSGQNFQDLLVSRLQR